MDKQNGITLVALVVTIIVLLILAGVTISLIIGQNGIIGKANDSKDAARAGSIRDEISQWKLEKEASEKVNWDVENEEDMLTGLKNKGLILSDSEIDRTNKLIMIGKNQISYKIEEQSYTVTYDLNKDQDFNPGDTSTPIDNQKYKKGDAVSCKSVTTTGYKKFIGWSLTKLNSIENTGSIEGVTFPEGIIKPEGLKPNFSYSNSEEEYNKMNYQSTFVMPDHNVILYAVYLGEVS